MILGQGVVVGPIPRGWLLGARIEEPCCVWYLVLFVPVSSQACGGVGVQLVVFRAGGLHGHPFPAARATERGFVKPCGKRVFLFLPLVPHYVGPEAGHVAAVIVVVCVVWSNVRSPG